MSEYSDRQAEFNYLQAKWAQWVHDTPDAACRKRRLRDGYAYRDQRCNNAVLGHPKSIHMDRMARDVMLDIMIEGKWVYQEQSEPYRAIGEKWESMHELARWGGAWGDGNHMSFEWQGVR